MGRPTKLTPEVQDKIVQAIRAGNFMSTAAAYAGAATEVQLVGHVLRDVAGGYIVTRRTRTLRDGSVEVEEDRAGPNGSLGLKVLQAAFPSRLEREGRGGAIRPGRRPGPG